MATTKCKTCRRTGQKLFLKNEKCSSSKCPMGGKPYPPGKRSKRRFSSSEYAQQLKEKQKLKFMYGLREKQFSGYVKEAMQKGGEGMSAFLYKLLELRLDNTVFRAGFAGSRSTARQIVGHGHICVNGRKVTIPSFRVSIGDKISIRSQSVSKSVFLDLGVFLKKYNAPEWISLDKTKKEAEVINVVEKGELDLGVDLNSVIEFYSR